VTHRTVVMYVTKDLLGPHTLRDTNVYILMINQF